MAEILFQAGGLEFIRSATGLLIHSYVELLGGLAQAGLTCEQLPMIRLLSNAQLRKGHAYTLRELRQIGNPGEHPLLFDSALRYLEERGALRRGYRIDCPHCGLRLWYPLVDIQAHIRCEGCRKEYWLPQELDFAYSLNPLAREALKSGALCVIRAARYLSRQDHIWLAGLEVQRRTGGAMGEVDLMLPYVPVVAECKDTIENAEKLLIQLMRLIDIGQVISAECYLATLDKTIPEDVAAFCAAKNIRVLTQVELVQV